MMGIRAAAVALPLLSHLWLQWVFLGRNEEGTTPKQARIHARRDDDRRGSDCTARVHRDSQHGPRPHHVAEKHLHQQPAPD